MINQAPLETQGSPPERVPTVGAAAGSAKGTTSTGKGRGPKLSDAQPKKYELLTIGREENELKWIKIGVFTQNYCKESRSPRQPFTVFYIQYQYNIFPYGILGAADST